MTGLLGALLFLTRLPAGRAPAHAGATDLARTVPWFPVAGALVGVLTAAGYAAGLRLVPPVLAASLAVAGQVLVTGALHEDGLADVADAAGGWSAPERSRILDDPRHGTFGVSALVLAILVRVTALATLGAAAALGALVAAHALGRGATVALMVQSPAPVRRAGLVTAHAEALTRRQAAAGLIAAAGLAGLGIGVWAAPAVAVTAAVALALARWSGRKLGGVNGDVLGAAAVLVEVAVLVLSTGAAAGDGPRLAWWT